MPNSLTSPGIARAMALADASSYVAKYGPDETYWPHFLGHPGVDATSADYVVALELIERVIPEATNFIAHLREMAEILKPDDESEPAMLSTRQFIVSQLMTFGIDVDPNQCDPTALRLDAEQIRSGVKPLHLDHLSACPPIFAAYLLDALAGIMEL